MHWVGKDPAIRKRPINVVATGTFSTPCGIQRRPGSERKRHIKLSFCMCPRRLRATVGGAVGTPQLLRAPVRWRKLSPPTSAKSWIHNRFSNRFDRTVPEWRIWHRQGSIEKSKDSNRFSKEFARGAPGWGVLPRRRRQQNRNKTMNFNRFSNRSKRGVPEREIWFRRNARDVPQLGILCIRRRQRNIKETLVADQFS